MSVESLTRRPFRVLAAAMAALLGFLLLTPLSHSAAVPAQTGAGDQPAAADQHRPAGMLPRRGPYPAGSSFVVRNAWGVGDAQVAISVYAGSKRSNRHTGELLILRTHSNGRQTLTAIQLPGTGPVSIDSRRLTQLDSEPERAAVRGRVPYRTADGRAGFLNLATNGLSPSR